MKKILLAIAMLFSMQVFASGDAVVLEKADIDLNDNASLQRGAKTFFNYCFSCHTLEYARYNRIAADLEIPEEVFIENLIFNNAKIGELMTNSMDKKDAKAWFGATPPDLTLVTRVRGEDWVYSYLKGFYADESRPWGVNNVVFPQVGMPHVLAELQGLCASKPHLGGPEVKVDSLSGAAIAHDACESYVQEGVMTPHEYDEAMQDLTAFLSYVGEPIQEKRKTIGIYVLLYLLLLFPLTYLIKRHYWNGIH